MPGLRPDIDPDGLREFSVVFTDRSLNHMSQSFQGVMNDISSTLKKVYNADAVAVIPGGGTFAMEAVARQFANREKTAIIRNGWFSFRWSQILQEGNIADAPAVFQARPVDDGDQPAYEPADIDEVIASISVLLPEVVFAPHVETSSGIILPDDYIKEIGDVTREAGGLFVLDCIASGAIWTDMKALDVDVLISAPQKGWSGSPCAGLVMLNERALARVEETRSSSFACDLKKWLEIMSAYENGGHAYHATMPTDGLRRFDEMMKETEAFGLETARERQQELGDKVRALLVSKGVKSVAAEGFEAPGVVVSYTKDAEIQNGKKFAEAGLQIAAGVPLRCDEPVDFQTFRLGLFGLDKLADVDGTVAALEAALDSVL